MKAIIRGLAPAFLVAAAAAVTPASAAPEVPVYDGTVRLTKINQACFDDGWRVGDTFSFVFRSQVRPSNRNGGGMQFLTSNFGMSFILPKGQALLGGRRTGVFTVAAFSTQVGTYSFKSTFDLNISPATITPATKSVKVSGVISGLSAIPNCVAAISGSGKFRR